MSDQYANELETWYAGLPSLVQEVLHEPFTWMNDALRAVAGDPPTLVAAGSQYAGVALAVRQIGASHSDDVAMLGQLWTGDAFTAFADRQQEFEDQIERTAGAIAQIEEVLKSAAAACVEGANAIIDIVVDLIKMALATIAVNVALSVISLGTSLAAAVAEIVAEAAVALARVARVVERIAVLLERIAQLMKKLAAILKEIKKLIEAIQAWLKRAKEASKAAKGSDWVRAKAGESAKKALVSKGITATTMGNVHLPGVGGSAKDAGVDTYQGYQDAGPVVEQAEQQSAEGDRLAAP